MDAKTLFVTFLTGRGGGLPRLKLKGAKATRAIFEEARESENLSESK